ncbi:hypothetical protein LCGC14_1139620 [marine sediment metagenome]|uniref:Uncharacterized protein n=1 Tax=marine sediment metagenome TaxID=412755 RepID=A0A0F9PGY6_9ZZZZ
MWFHHIHHIILVMKAIIEIMFITIIMVGDITTEDTKN